MDIKSFIESGILESYLLGACSEAECREVEHMAATHPEVQAELDTLEETLALVAEQAAIPPPSALRQKVIDAVQDFEKNKPSPPSSVPKGRFNWWILVGLLGLISTGYFFGKNTALQSTLSEKEALLQSCEEQAKQRAQMRTQIAVLSNPNTQTVAIAPLPEKPPTLSATVFHNVEQGKTLLDFEGLAAPPAGKSYQLWALVDGAPVSMDVIDLSPLHDAKLREVPFIQNAQAFAISIEPEGGSETPTEVIMVGQG